MSYVIVGAICLLLGFGAGILFDRKNGQKLSADIAKVQDIKSKL